jgi:hypothetical protein
MRPRLATKYRSLTVAALKVASIGAATVRERLVG